MKNELQQEMLLLKNASFGYDGKAVVENLNFRVAQGDYLCIVGENGSGKSTLMKGLLKLNKPLCGEIEYKNSLKNNQIGYLPQQNSAQKDFPASVQEIVYSGFINRHGLRPFYSKEEKDKSNAVLASLGIEKLKKQSFSELSGGQQQKVLLARVLCASDTMLLLDEPVAGLDPEATKDMYTLIQKLNQQNKMTIIMISHDLAGVTQYASHILRLQKQQLFFGSKEEYLQSQLVNKKLPEVGCDN